jgi:predicted RNase H-like nuclease (RuvC/YqgF family)
MEIPKKLKDEIWEYCRLNDISNIEDFIIKMVRQGYTVEKFGATPLGTGEVKEVEKVVEVIKEVPVEKIVEVIKEIPVEKIVEKEVYITDDKEVEKLTKELESVKKNESVHLKGLREKVNEINGKDGEIDTLNRKISDLNNKILQLEGDLGVKKVEIDELNGKITKLEEENKKNNKDIYDDERRGGWFGSNLLNRK